VGVDVSDLLNKYMLFRIAIIISIILFAFLILSVDTGQVVDVIAKVNPVFILIALGTLLLEILFKSWRLQIMTKIFAPLSFTNSLKVFLIGRPFGVVTPGQVGDLARTYSLADKTGLKNSQSLALSFLDKAFDLFFLLVLAALGLVGALFLLSNGTRGILYILIMLVILIAVLITFIIKKNWIKFFLKPLFKLLVPHKFRAGLRASFEDFYRIFLAILKNKKALPIIVISLIIWPLVSIRVYFLAAALGISAQFIYFLAFIPTIAFIEMLPISIMGIGPREYAYILFFSLIKIDKEQSLSLSLLSLITNGIPVALIGYYFVLKEEIRAKKIPLIE